MVEEDNTPLAVTVTPCDAPLEWKLTVQELPEEASGEGSGNKPSMTYLSPQRPAFLLDLKPLRPVLVRCRALQQAHVYDLLFGSSAPVLPWCGKAAGSNKTRKRAVKKST